MPGAQRSESGDTITFLNISVSIKRILDHLDKKSIKDIVEAANAPAIINIGAIMQLTEEAIFEAYPHQSKDIILQKSYLSDLKFIALCIAQNIGLVDFHRQHGLSDKTTLLISKNMVGKLKFYKEA